MSAFSLEKLKDDPDFAELFAKKANEIRHTKANLLEAAREYQDKYDEVIERGTLTRQLKLEEGRSHGLSDDDIFKDNKLFIPTKETPVLNYLFFLLRETRFEDVDIRVLRNYCDADKDIQLLKEEYSQKYGTATHETVRDTEIPNFVSFIYGSIGDDTMALLKKLKTLSMSENEKEAFVAFRKGREMCSKFKLEWDKIPINN